MKKLLSLLLALAILGSLCTFAVAEEPKVLTIGSIITKPDYENNVMIKKIEEKLNIKVEFNYYDTDQYSVMLTDGTLPDIMLSKYEYLQNVMASGLALNIEPYIDEYMPNLRSSLYQTSLEVQQALFPTEDNGIYFICPAVGIWNANGGDGQYRGYIVRWDYYKEIGCPEINNDDDYLAALLQMYENHPVNENGKPNYPMGVYGNLKNMGGYRASWLVDVAVNLWSSTYYFKSSMYDGSLINCYTNTERSSYWKDMTFYNKVYRTGFFDEDIFTMSGDEYDAKVAEGRYMGIAYVDNSLYNDKIKEDPETLAGYVVVPSKGSILYADCMLMMGNAPTYHGFINAKSENKELAMKFYNELYDLDYNREMYSGVQGVDWDYDENGVPYMFDTTVAKIANNDETFIGVGYHSRDPYLTAYNPACLHTDGYPLDLLESSSARADSQNYLQRDYAAYYDVEYWVDAMYNIMGNCSSDSGETVALALSEIPTERKRVLENCNDILYQSMPALIMAESDEEFAEIQADVIAQLEELGVEEQYEWYKEQWSPAAEKAGPLFDAYAAQYK